MFTRIRLAALIALAILLAPVAALAQAAATASPTAWDYSSLLTLAIQIVSTILIPVLGILISGLVAKQFKVTDLKQQELMRNTVNNVLEKGVAYAQGFMPTGPMTIDVHNAAVANVLAYATQHAPDALQYFGLKGDDGVMKLQSMIIARLAAAGLPVPTATAPAQ